MIKAVAIDLDGTLTDNERRLDLDAISRLRELEDLGIKVSLATGNILLVAEAASIFVGASGPIIAENGGVVMNRETREIKYLGNIDKIEIAFYHLAQELNVTRLNMSELRKTEIAIPRQFDVKLVREVLKDHPVKVVDTKFAIHLMDPGVSKGKALKIVADMLGVSLEDIVAVGDSENDREMLELAGYSISVGEESLRDVCDYITGAKYGEGGCEALSIILSLVRQKNSK